MNNLSSSSSQPGQYYAIFFGISLTVLIVFSFILNINNLDKQAINIATAEARTNWNKDQVFRRWATRHGGVYVKPDERTPPSPFMRHLPHRDVETTDGMKLTLMNPASMMSQMVKEFETLYGIKGKITGQIPLNSANKPDQWELKGLKQFDKGVKEVLEQADIDGQPFIRFMRPMIMTEGCVSCHGHLGFKVGDIGGGVSISVPLTPYFEAAQESKVSLFFTHGVVWLIGVLTISFFYWLGNRRGQEKRQADEALRESHTRIKGLMENIPSGISISSPEGDVHEINASILRIFGYDSKEEFLNTPIEKLYVNSVDRERFIALSKKGLVKNMELQFRHKDGSLFWGSVTSIKVLTGAGKAEYINVLEDITKRKQMELQLRKMAQVVDQSPESIVITNLDAEIEYVNEAFMRTTGYRPDEVLGQNPRMLSSGKTPPENYVAMWDALKRGQIWEGELFNKRKDGTEYIEFAQVSPIFQPDASITHYMATKQNITEKKRLAEELEKHRHHLEELVEERTRQLAAASEQAEAANQAKSAFLANMSHEIRTPMNAIIGLTHLMQRAEPELEQVKRLNKIDNAASHLLSIINNILDISKIEAGMLTLEQANFRLDEVLDQTMSLLKELASAKDLVIEADCHAAPIWLRGDPTRLRQALLNYAGNAIKFTERGSIFLRVKKLEEQGNKILLRFEVQDTGIGIEPDQLSHIFHAFEQADASTTRKHGGTGLGLTINQYLAQLMGGEAGAESEPGRGSTFWFTAWLEQGHGVQPTVLSKEIFDAETALQDHHKGARILLVEDNEINREVALDLLNDVGLVVDIAVNGGEAVEKVRANDYGLILMDIQMPVMDGLEATGVIRAMAGKTDIPILAMTANIFEDDYQACQKAGMNDFISKPFDLESFFSTIIKWLPKPAVLKDDDHASISPSPSRDSSQRPTHVITPVAGQEDSPVDLMVLVKLLGGNKERHIPLLKKFIPQTEAIMAETKAAYEARDAEKIAFLAHKLKSSARTVGANALADLCVELEKAGRSEDWLVIDNLYPELAPAMGLVRDFINEL